MINSEQTAVKKLTWLTISLRQGENEKRELNTGLMGKEDRKGRRDEI